MAHNYWLFGPFLRLAVVDGHEKEFGVGGNLAASSLYKMPGMHGQTEGERCIERVEPMKLINTATLF